LQGGWHEQLTRDGRHRGEYTNVGNSSPP